MTETNNSTSESSTVKHLEGYHFQSIQERLQACVQERFAEVFDTWAKGKRLPYKLEQIKATHRGAVILYREIVWSAYWKTDIVSSQLRRKTIARQRLL